MNNLFNWFCKSDELESKLLTQSLSCIVYFKSLSKQMINYREFQKIEKKIEKSLVNETAAFDYKCMK